MALTYNTIGGSSNRILGSASGIPRFINNDDTLNWDLDTVTFTTSTSFTVDGGPFSFTGSNFDLGPTGTFNLTMAGSNSATITTGSSATAFRVLNDSGNAMLSVDTSTGAVAFGNVTDNPAYSFLGSSAAAFGGGVTIAAGGSITGDGELTLASGASQDLLFKTGDNAGLNKFSFLDSDSSEVASIDSNGGFTVADLTVNNDLTVSGDLTVNGTTTTVDSTTVTIGDNLIVVNSGPSDVTDAGYMVKRYQTENDTGIGDVISSDTAADSGTAQAGAASTITFEATESAVDDFYNNWWVLITTGTGANQVRLVSDYVGATKTATVQTAWTTPPDATSTYELFNRTYAVVYWNEISGGWVLGSTTSDPGSFPITNTDYLDLVVGTLTPQDGVFLPDDVALELGNTVSVPDARLYWSSSDSRVTLNSPLTAAVGQFQVVGASGPLGVSGDALLVYTEVSGSSNQSKSNFNLDNSGGTALVSGQSVVNVKSSITPAAGDDANSDYYAFSASTSASVGRTTGLLIASAFDTGIQNDATLDQNGASDFSGDMTVSGAANVVLSTSGTINQTGAGQVTFSGNVDASNGLDVAGGDFSFTGTSGSWQIVESTSALTQNGTGQVTLTGNLDAGNGVDVAGGDLSFTGTAGGWTFAEADSALTQTGSGQVTFTGNVDASSGIDVSGSPLTTAAGFTQTGGVYSATATTYSTAATTSISFTGPASTGAFDVQVGTDDYIKVNGTAASEAIDFGNTNTNPDYNFLGSGTTTFGGSLSPAGGVSFPDTVSLTFGTDNDFYIWHDPSGTDDNITLFDNVNVLGHTVFALGTDDTDTQLAVRNNSGTNLFQVEGDGSISHGRWTKLNINDAAGNDTGLFQSNPQVENDAGTFYGINSSDPTETDEVAQYLGLGSTTTPTAYESLVLTAGLQAQDDAYKGWFVWASSGLLAGQIRQIVGYDHTGGLSEKLATLNTPWTPVDSGAGATWSGSSGTATITCSTDVSGSIGASDTIIIDRGNANEEAKKVLSSVWSGTTQTITLTTNLSNTHTNVTLHLGHPSSGGTGTGDSVSLFAQVNQGFVWDGTDYGWVLAAGPTAPTGSDTTWPTVTGSLQDFGDLRLGNLYVEDDIYMVGSAINFNESGTAPTATNNTGWVYTQDSGGITELHYKDDLANGGNAVQITLDGALNRDAVILENIASPTPTYTNVQDLQNTYHSSGWIGGGAVTSGAGSTINVAAGRGAIRSTNDREGTLLFFNWVASTGNAIADGETKYVGVEYNSGSPQVTVRSSENWNYNTDFPLATCVREGTSVHVEFNPQAVGDHASLMVQRAYETSPLARNERAGGLVIGTDSGTNGAESDTSGVGNSTTTLVLGASASSSDSFYNGWTLEITSGALAGTKRTITAYVGSTKTVTVDVSWGGTPADNVTYTVTARYVTMTGGSLWDRLNKYSISALDTDPDGTASTFDIYYVSGAGPAFTKLASQDQWPNYQINTLNTLTDMTDGYYASVWFYLEADGELLAMYGQQEFPTLAQATDDTAPGSVPPRIEAHGRFLGRIIFQKHGDTADQVLTTWDTGSGGGGGGGVTDHGSLSGLGDDDHTQYLLADGTRAMSGNLDMGSNDITVVGDIGTASAGASNIYVDADYGLRIAEAQNTPPTNVTSAVNTGWVYTKEDSGSGTRTELWYMDSTGDEVQLTAGGEINISEITFTLDDAYQDGNTISVNGTGTGAVVLDVDYDVVGGYTGLDVNILNTTLDQTFTGIDIAASTGIRTAGGIGQAITFTNLSATSQGTYTGLDLNGSATAVASATLNAIDIDANWDAGIVNAAPLNQDGTSDFSANLTMSGGQLIVTSSSSQLLQDTSVLYFGTGAAGVGDYSVSSDGTDLFFDMGPATGDFLFQLGTADDQATSFVVEDSGGAHLWTVFADGSIISAGGSPIPVGGGGKGWTVDYSSDSPGSSAVTGLGLTLDNSGVGTPQDGTNSGSIYAANFHVKTNNGDTAGGGGYEGLHLTTSAEGTAMTGTVSVTAGDETITGSGTSFTTEVTFGDIVVVNGETMRIVAVVSDTEMEAEAKYAASASGVAVTLIEPSQVTGIRVGSGYDVGTRLHDQKWNGIKLDTGTSLNFGTAAKSTLTGTVAVAGTVGTPSTTVTGTGTAFDTELSAGDVIEISGFRKVVRAIASATSLTVRGAGFQDTASGITAFVVDHSMDIAFGDDLLRDLGLSGVHGLSLLAQGSALTLSNAPLFLSEIDTTEVGSGGPVGVSLPMSGVFTSLIAGNWNVADASSSTDGMQLTFDNVHGTASSSSHSGVSARLNPHASDTYTWSAFKAGWDSNGSYNSSISSIGFRSSREYTTSLRAEGSVEIQAGGLMVSGMQTNPSAGTVSITAGGTTVTGSGTAFQTGGDSSRPEVFSGSYIKIGDQIRIVDTVSSDTSLTVTEAFDYSMSGTSDFYYGSAGISLPEHNSGLLESKLVVNRRAATSGAAPAFIAHRYQDESDAAALVSGDVLSWSGPLHSGNLPAQSSNPSTTLTLDAGASATDSTYNEMWVRDTGGSSALTVGTSISASGTTVTGVGTSFDTEIAVGDWIEIPAGSDDVSQVTNVASATSLTVSAAFANDPISGATTANRLSPQFNSVRRISGYSGASKQVTVYSDWAPVTLQGTVTVGAASASVTGSGTLFTVQLEAGDLITIAGEQVEVASVTSNTALTLGTAHTAGATGSSYTLDRPSGNSSFAVYGQNYHGLVFDPGYKEWSVAGGPTVDFVDSLSTWERFHAKDLALNGQLWLSQQAASPADHLYSTAVDGGAVYTKDVSGTPELFYRGLNASEIQLTSGAGLSVTHTLDLAYDGGGSGAGREITVDSGPVSLHHNIGSGSALEVFPNASAVAGNNSAIDVDLSGLTITANYNAYKAWWTGATITVAQDYKGVSLYGVTNSHASYDSIGFYADGFDYALQAGDSTPIAVGTGKDLAITFDGTDAVFDQTTGVGMSTIFQLGSDTSSNDFLLADDTGNILFSLDGSGAGYFDADINIRDDRSLSFGTDTDWSLTYDETTNDALELTGATSAATVAGTAFVVTGSEGGAGNGGVGGAGGEISLTAGTGGYADTALAGDGGSLTLTAGTGGLAANGVAAAGAGGDLTISSGVGGGASGTDQASGAGGALTFQAGSGGAAGTTGGAGGDITITAGSGTGSAAGGDITVNGGFSASGTDGTVTLGSTNTSAVNIGNVSADTSITALDIHLDATGEVVSNSDLNAHGTTAIPVAGDLCALTSTGVLQTADNTTANGRVNVVGIAANSAGGGNRVELASLYGTLCVVSTSLGSMSVGDVIYLGAAGAVTSTAPTASGTTVWRLGYVVNTSTNQIFYQPQFIGNNP